MQLAFRGDCMRITGVVAGMWAKSCPRQERHHESHASREEAMQYLVQMKLADSVRPRSPEEAIGFIEQYGNSVQALFNCSVPSKLHNSVQQEVVVFLYPRFIALTA